MGWLYLPDEVESGKCGLAIVMAHVFSDIKEMKLSELRVESADYYRRLSSNRLILCVARNP